MEQLLHLDQSLFHFINHDCKNIFLDGLLPYWRNKYVWIPFYLILLIAIIQRFHKKGLILVAALLLSVSMTDFTSSWLIKNQVERIRPCNQVGFKETAHLLVPCGSGYSFTSSHAANHFSIAIFLILTVGVVWTRLRLLFFLWALSIALAQVYVGVHYPLDVLGGAIIGSLIGGLSAFCLMRYNDYLCTKEIIK